MLDSDPHQLVCWNWRLIRWSSQEWLVDLKSAELSQITQTFGKDDFTLWLEGGFVIVWRESKWFIQYFSFGWLVVDWQVRDDREDLKEINGLLLSRWGAGGLEIKVFQQFQVIPSIPIQPSVPKLTDVYLSLILGLKNTSVFLFMCNVFFLLLDLLTK